VLRKFIGERISVGSGGVARKAIFVVQPAQNRRRDHLSVFGQTVTGGHKLLPFERRLGNPGSQAGVLWAWNFGRRCNPVQGATASLAFTATLAL
jgi:hypothetical protein